MSLKLASIISAVMLIIDRITKVLAQNTLAISGDNPPIIKGILSLYYTENTGAGFSVLSGRTGFLIAFTIIVMVLIVVMLVKGTFKHMLTDWGFCLVLSGGIGNLIDRVFNDGAVVDFIKTDFIDFPIFNVADICVTIGAVLIILYFVVDLVNDQKNSKRNIH